jgi:hypothetical protein
MFYGVGNRMGEIVKPSDKQGCHIWHNRVSRSSVDTQTSPPAVIRRVTERRSACFILMISFPNISAAQI